MIRKLHFKANCVPFSFNLIWIKLFFFFIAFSKGKELLFDEIDQKHDCVNWNYDFLWLEVDLEVVLNLCTSKKGISACTLLNHQRIYIENGKWEKKHQRIFQYIFYNCSTKKKIYIFLLKSWRGWLSVYFLLQ